nr:T-complex protein 1 subunit beta-like [Tanacetum cinerariifolium]
MGLRLPPLASHESGVVIELKLMKNEQPVISSGFASLADLYNKFSGTIVRLAPTACPDKILQSTCRENGVTVTNDSATILKSLHIDNPAAKVLIDISKVQDDEVGDGTTSVVVLAGELLRDAENTIQGPRRRRTALGESSGLARSNYASTSWRHPWNRE